MNACPTQLISDSDSEVGAFVRISESYHSFVYLNYIRNDGLIASYFPDFMVRIRDQVYLVETKADKDMDNENVLSKERAALDWVKKINALKPDDRMVCNWNYVLMGENGFYQLKNNGASINETLEFGKNKTEGVLEGFLED